MSDKRLTHWLTGYDPTTERIVDEHGVQPVAVNEAYRIAGVSREFVGEVSLNGGEAREIALLVGAKIDMALDWYLSGHLDATEAVTRRQED